MIIGNGIHMLAVSATVLGRTQSIHPVLMCGESGAVLADTAFPGQLPLLKQEILNAGLRLESIRKVIITHQDVDHIGSLPALAEALQGKIDVMASREEQPFIQGEKRLLKLTPEAIGQAVRSLPDSMPEAMKAAFRHTLENPPQATVTSLAEDDEVLPDCGGIRIIATPGHTTGHISLYHESSKTLIAGDALTVQDGELLRPDPRLCHDAEEAVRSLRQFTRFDVQSVICFHGGLYQTNCNARLAELAGV